MEIYSTGIVLPILNIVSNQKTVSISLTSENDINSQLVNRIFQRPTTYNCFSSLDIVICWSELKMELSNKNSTTDILFLKKCYKDFIREDFLNAFGRLYCNEKMKVPIFDRSLKTDCNHCENDDTNLNTHNNEIVTYVKNILFWLDPKMDYNNFEQVPKVIKQRFFKTSYFQVGEQTSRVCLYYKLPDVANKVSDELSNHEINLFNNRSKIIDEIDNNFEAKSFLQDDLIKSTSNCQVLEKNTIDLCEKTLFPTVPNSEVDSFGPEAEIDKIFQNIVCTSTVNDSALVQDSTTEVQEFNSEVKKPLYKTTNDFTDSCMKDDSIIYETEVNNVNAESKVVHNSTSDLIKNKKFIKNRSKIISPDKKKSDSSSKMLEQPISDFSATDNKPSSDNFTNIKETTPLIGKRSSNSNDSEIDAKNKKMKLKYNETTPKSINKLKDETHKTSILDSANKPIKYLYNRNRKGETLMHTACSKGNLELVMSLLSQGFNPNVKDHAGWTPLHETVKTGRLDIVEELLKYGAFINVPGFEYETPLHIAIKYNQLDIAKILLENGADSKCENIYGENSESIDLEVWGSLSNARSLCLSTEKNLIYEPDQLTIVVNETNLNSVVVNKFCKQFNIKLAKNCLSEKNYVTHIVVANSSNNVCLSNVECLTGIANGLFIVQQNWISDSLQKNKLLSCDEYEVRGTKQFIDCNGPFISRINNQKLNPKLFDGINVHICGNGSWGHFTSEDIKKLVIEFGAKILKRMPNPEDCPSNVIPFHCRKSELMKYTSTIILYTNDSSRLIKYNMKHLKVFHVSWFFEVAQKYTFI
ncbi:BRCA1-associated RING domain protein 1-like isoform X2 [Daktulosphaira vitifoliae]|nr:BRCA1-associated RING domain protein 1-like isoform X2 [Daktulosphaira vitifoliae]